MVNKKSAAKEPTTLNPDMRQEIMDLMRAQGIELDADAIKMLNQVAGEKFEETYHRIAEDKAKEGTETTVDENMEEEPTSSGN